MTYESLLSQIEPHLDKSRAELPLNIVEMLRGRVEQFQVVEAVINNIPQYGERVRKVPGRAPNLYAVWDDLFPAGRRYSAVQYDAQHDPANEMHNDSDWNHIYEIDVLQKAIQERELMAPQTYSELEEKEKSLLELQVKLADRNRQFNNDAWCENDNHDESTNKGITKQQALIAFESPCKDFALKKILENTPKWIEDARLRKGKPGPGHPTIWNPVILAIALIEYKRVPKPHINKAFYEHNFLAGWRDEWMERSKEMR